MAGLVIAALVLLAPPLAGQDVTDAERFTLLHDSLGALSTDYGNDVLKTIGSLLLAIGWLMMSEASRKFLRDNRQVRGTALVVVPLMAVSNAVWLINRFVVSERKVRLLRELNYVSEAYYTGEPHHAHTAIDRSRLTPRTVCGTVRVCVLAARKR